MRLGSLLKLMPWTPIVHLLKTYFVQEKPSLGAADAYAKSSSSLRRLIQIAAQRTNVAPPLISSKNIKQSHTTSSSVIEPPVHLQVAVDARHHSQADGYEVDIAPPKR